MNEDEDFGRELGDRLRTRAEHTPPRVDLATPSQARAHRVMRHRRIASVAAGVLAIALAGGVVSGTMLLRQGETRPAGPPPTSLPSAFTPSSGVPSAVPSAYPPAASSTPTQLPPSASATTPPTTPPPGTSSSAVPANTAACTAGHTKVSVAPAPGGGYAGGYVYLLKVVNTGSTPCALAGFAGVSMVYGDSGTQLGAPATRDGAAHVVTLKPGASAQAQLTITDAGNYGPECKMTTARGFRIYLPNDTNAKFAPLKVTGCANPTIDLMRIASFGA